jgi:hypothetical protein
MMMLRRAVLAALAILSLFASPASAFDAFPLPCHDWLKRPRNSTQDQALGYVLGMAILRSGKALDLLEDRGPAATLRFIDDYCVLHPGGKVSQAAEFLVNGLNSLAPADAGIPMVRAPK